MVSLQCVTLPQSHMYILQSFALLGEASCLIRQTYIYSIIRDMQAVIGMQLTLAKSVLQALAAGSLACSHYAAGSAASYFVA